MATSVQYGIRHLMALTAAVAVVMAVLGPMIRAWDTERQIAFTVYLAAPLLLLACCTYHLCTYRVRVERAAGDVLLRIRTSDHPLIKRLLVAIMAFFGVLMIGASILLSGFWIGDGTDILNVVWLSLWPAMVISPLVTRLWWGLNSGSIEVCERGLTLGAYEFLSYSKLKHYRWERYFANKLVLFRRFGDGGWEIRLRIPTDMRDEVGRLLEEHSVPRRERRY